MHTDFAERQHAACFVVAKQHMRDIVTPAEMILRRNGAFEHVNAPVWLRNSPRASLQRELQSSGWFEKRCCDRHRMFSLVSPSVVQITTDEIASELVGGLHHDEAASRRVDDHVAGLGGGTDQSGDQIDGLDMWVNAAVDFLRPTAADSMVPPGSARSNWFLLQYDQIIAASP
jgi:hypothetical protein